MSEPVCAGSSNWDDHLWVPVAQGWRCDRCGPGSAYAAERAAAWGPDERTVAAIGRLEATRVDTRATVWVHPGRCGGSPCIYGTRITTEAIANSVWQNGPDRALDCWPHLTIDDLKVACWYEATHGNRRHWKKRFGQWALDHGEAMWRSDWERVPIPPCTTTE